MGKHIDAAQLHHIVAAALEAGDPLERDVAASRHLLRNVVRVETDAGRDIVLVQACDHHIACVARLDQRPVIDAQNF